MIRVMIVEDDSLFRRNITSMLNWESLGFVVCGECVHGRDALKRMAEYAPNVVFTDISMPQMNGIELIRALKKDYPSVRIIVLSSFDDFEFVKEAMKLGADDYILKHELGHSMEQLLKVLEETKVNISDTASERLLGDEEARQIILDALMNRILSGRIHDKNEIEQHLRRLVVYFRFDRYMLAVVTWRQATAVTDMETEARSEGQTGLTEAGRFRQAVLGMGDRPASSQRLTFLVDDRTGVCIFNVKGMFSQSRIHEAVHAACRELFGGGLELSVGVSGMFEDVAALPLSYRQAQAAGGQGFLYARQALAFHTGAPERGMPKELPTHVNTMRDVMEQADEAAAEAWAEKLADIVYGARMSVAGLEELCDSLNGHFRHWAGAKNIKMEEITRHGRIRPELLAVSDSKEVFAAYLSGCFKRAFSVDKWMPQTTNPRVRQAIEYISVHYREPIGLREVSRVLDITENYLSNLFKQETGWRFVEYLNEVRLHHAKRLVANGNLKVYQIARQCGFHSTAYFCRIFKEKTGMSLTMHRKKENPVNK